MTSTSGFIEQLQSCRAAHVHPITDAPRGLVGPQAPRSAGAIPTQFEHKHYGAHRAAFDQRMIKLQSLPFRSDIRDVVDAAVYLLSPLSRFITGQELHVNGGMYMG
jgi:NAD(P)-dependent dehydrogenase (short-subunit alcohol dehydrogenase family)